MKFAAQLSVIFLYSAEITADHNDLTLSPIEATVHDHPLATPAQVEPVVVPAPIEPVPVPAHVHTTTMEEYPETPGPTEYFALETPCPTGDAVTEQVHDASLNMAHPSGGHDGMMPHDHSGVNGAILRTGLTTEAGVVSGAPQVTIGMVVVMVTMLSLMATF